MHIDLTDLRLFAAIAEAGNLTRGANRVFLTAPAASARIKSLEQELHARLLNRGNKGVTLTPPGERFLQHAQVILRQLEYLREDFSEQGSIGGQVRVFANTTAVTEFMPEILVRFLSDRPGLSVDLQEKQTHEIIRAVLAGTADLGIVSGPVDAENLEVVPFSTDRLVLATAQNHPLSKQPQVWFRDTLQFDHVGLHEDSTLFAFLRDLMDKSGHRRALRVQVPSFEAMCRLIGSGIGIGIVPFSAVRRHIQSSGISVVEMSDDWAVRTRSILVRDRSALPRSALALIEELQVAGLGGDDS